MPSNSQRGVDAGFVVVDSHKAIYFYCLHSRERKLANLCTKRSRDEVSELIWSQTQPKLYIALNPILRVENSSFIAIFSVRLLLSERTSSHRTLENNCKSLRWKTKSVVNNGPWKKKQRRRRTEAFTYILKCFCSGWRKWNWIKAP